VADDDVVMDAHRPVDIARGDPELAFHEFVAFNDGHFAVFRASGAGAGPWEMHPDTDELLFALEGSVTVEGSTPAGTNWCRSGLDLSSSSRAAAGTAMSTRTTWWSCTTRQGRASRAKIRQQHPATKADDHRPPRPLPPIPVRAGLMLRYRPTSETAQAV
jgi:hypothetical protein